MGELRQYPRGAWLGFRPLGSPLEQEFDDPDEVDAILARVRRCGTVVAGELVLPNSGDSWNWFCSTHGTYEFFTEYQPEHLRAAYGPRPVSMRAQREQERWEAEQLARRQARQAEADALWAAEEQRLTRAASAAASAAKAARDYHLAMQERQATTLMDRWNALVARKGWTPAEAAERWNDWLTGPPGFFG
jgi:hypothetical protein